MKITIGGHEYESGKITREKYRSFCETYENFLNKEKNDLIFSDEDLDEMIRSIVKVYGDQFTFEEAEGELDEIADIILNFSMINAEISNKSELQAQKCAESGKANVIRIAGKEYSSGKIGRKKYKIFREYFGKLSGKEKMTYTDGELDEMIRCIVKMYDDQFTFEEANAELQDVSEIIFNFGLINASILKKMQDNAETAKKNLTAQV